MEPQHGTVAGKPLPYRELVFIHPSEYLPLLCIFSPTLPLPVGLDYSLIIGRNLQRGVRTLISPSKGTQIVRKMDV